MLNDSLRSYVVPFLKAVRDEWFVSGTESVQPDANGIIKLPNSVASTIRTIWWNNNNNFVPLTRVEPENSYAFLGQNGGNQPCGYMLKGYEIQILPSNIGSVTVRIAFMERPADMVQESDAGYITVVSDADLTLESTPLAWQSTAPAEVEIWSSESPFLSLGVFAVSSLGGGQLTVVGSPDPAIPVGSWVADVGCSPFPSVPIEFHPLLQRSVITEIYTGTGDKRLEASMKVQAKLEADLRRTMAPRTQGSARPIVNKNGPGMGAWRGGYRGGR